MYSTSDLHENSKYHATDSYPFQDLNTTPELINLTISLYMVILASELNNDKR